jgi:hypothetical protein
MNSICSLQTRLSVFKSAFISVFLLVKRGYAKDFLTEKETASFQRTLTIYPTTGCRILDGTSCNWCRSLKTSVISKAV